LLYEEESKFLLKNEYIYECSITLNKAATTNKTRGRGRRN
jgi:hypothetical protein